MEKVCEFCGKVFQIPKGNSPKQRFCGTSCSAKWRMKQPTVLKKMQGHWDNKEKLSLIMKKMHQENPHVRQISSKNMKENNPTKRPEVVEKIKKHWGQFGHPLSKQQIKGGNGRPLPVAQRVLFAALGSGWVPEFPIPTKRKSPFPTNYKVDLAYPEKKVWIEVDGWGHLLPEGKMRDRKKEYTLRLLGWKGLRFTNQKIMEELPSVLKEVKKFII